jgi:hypothetical protein
MAPWGWGEGRQKYFFAFPNILQNKYLFKHLPVTKKHLV